MKKNAWNIRRLVDDSFVPATQRIILKIVGFWSFGHSDPDPSSVSLAGSSLKLGLRIPPQEI